MNKLYIAAQICSLAAQRVANELGLTPELIHYNVFDKTTSNDDNFAEVNPLGYVPVLVLDNADQDRISETIVLTSYLAAQHPQANLIPTHGTLERVHFDQLLAFLATEIAQKHIPLMRKLFTEIEHLQHLMAYVARVEARPSAQKALKTRRSCWRFITRKPPENSRRVINGLPFIRRPFFVCWN